jgi:hypothetical protein
LVELTRAKPLAIVYNHKFQRFDLVADLNLTASVFEVVEEAFVFQHPIILLK